MVAGRVRFAVRNSGSGWVKGVDLNVGGMSQTDAGPDTDYLRGISLSFTGAGRIYFCTMISLIKTRNETEFHIHNRLRKRY